MLKGTGFFISMICLNFKRKMENKIDLINERFPQFNCCQTVFSLFAGELGLETETAFKIASGFGGGMACAETCGAITGSYMVIGMKYGHTTPDPVAKENTKTKIKQFNAAFKSKHGSLICKDLTGYDISTEEGQQGAKEEDVFNKKCPEFLKTACNILEEQF